MNEIGPKSTENGDPYYEITNTFFALAGWSVPGARGSDRAGQLPGGSSARDASGMLLQSPGGQVVTALPVDTCTLVDTTRTCELWAMPGEITMPDGAVVPIWGFADNAAGPALLPGPMLIANQGETLEVVLHNELLAETVALEFPGQPDLLPDLAGVAAGGSTTYTFPVNNPGTFLYEAGLTENGTRQVAMGLYGALIVRPPTPGQAYDDIGHSVPRRRAAGIERDRLGIQQRSLWL